MQHAKKMVLVDPRLLSPVIPDAKDTSLRNIQADMSQVLSSESKTDYEKNRNINQLLFTLLKKMDKYFTSPTVSAPIPTTPTPSPPPPPPPPSPSSPPVNTQVVKKPMIEDEKEKKMFDSDFILRSIPLKHRETSRLLLHGVLAETETNEQGDLVHRGVTIPREVVKALVRETVGVKSAAKERIRKIGSYEDFITLLKSHSVKDRSRPRKRSVNADIKPRKRRRGRRSSSFPSNERWENFP